MTEKLQVFSETVLTMIWTAICVATAILPTELLWAKDATLTHTYITGVLFGIALTVIWIVTLYHWFHWEVQKS